MKLRLKHNSIRLRLTQTEVAQLRDGGVVEEYIEFPQAGRLTYRIEAGGDAVTALYRDGNILLAVPRPMIEAWANSSRVGMEADGPLRILIEKDFQCLDAADPKDNIDTFPNPQEGKIC
ncbi:MAG: hypothetical protein ABJF23_34305 [Bryobacteraceae bacterium]